MNKIALLINVCADDRTAERVILASNVEMFLPVGRTLQSDWSVNSLTTVVCRKCCSRAFGRIF